MNGLHVSQAGKTEKNVAQYRLCVDDYYVVQ